MAGFVQRTVFISYRRIAPFHARAVYQHLTANGYDVFMDVERMDSGAFDEILLRQIAARAHFVLLLTPGALDRCINPDDWLRREIEHAIDMKRNIVPVIFDDFDWNAAKPFILGKLALLQPYNGIRVPKENEYFDAAMERLKRFLNIDVDAVIHPTPAADKPIVAERQAEVEAAPPVTEKELTAEQYVSQAYEFDQAGRYDEAIAAANKAIRLDPKYTAAYVSRGAAYDSKGDYERAIVDYDEAIRLDPKLANAYNNRGAAYNYKRDYDRAIADLTEAIRLDPKLAASYGGRGFAYYRKGDYHKALSDQTQAVAIEPMPLRYRNRAATYRKLGMTADADEREAERLEREGK